MRVASIVVGAMLCMASTCVAPEPEWSRVWSVVYFPEATGAAAPPGQHYLIKGSRALLAVDARGMGLQRSVDGGGTWTSVPLPLGRVSELALEPNGTGLLLLNPRRLLATLDDGQSWFPVDTSALGRRLTLVRNYAGRVSVGEWPASVAHVVLAPAPRLERDDDASVWMDDREATPKLGSPITTEPGLECTPSGPAVDATHIVTMGSELMNIPNGAPFAAVESTNEGVFLRWGDTDGARVFRDDRVELWPAPAPEGRLVAFASVTGLVVSTSAERGSTKVREAVSYEYASRTVRRFEIRTETPHELLTGNGLYSLEPETRCVRRVSLDGAGPCVSFPEGLITWLPWQSGLLGLQLQGSKMIPRWSTIATDTDGRPRSSELPFVGELRPAADASRSNAHLQLLFGRPGVLVSEPETFAFFLPFVDGAVSIEAARDLRLPLEPVTSYGDCHAQSGASFHAPARGPRVRWLRPQEPVMEVIASEVSIRVPETRNACTAGYAGSIGAGSPFIVFGSASGARAIWSSSTNSRVLIPSRCREVQLPSSERSESF